MLFQASKSYLLLFQTKLYKCPWPWSMWQEINFDWWWKMFLQHCINLIKLRLRRISPNADSIYLCLQYLAGKGNLQIKLRTIPLLGKYCRGEYWFRIRKLLTTHTNNILASTIKYFDCCNFRRIFLIKELW